MSETNEAALPVAVAAPAVHATPRFPGIGGAFQLLALYLLLSIVGGILGLLLFPDQLPRALVLGQLLGLGAPLWWGFRRRGVRVRSLLRADRPSVVALTTLPVLLVGVWILLFSAQGYLMRVWPLSESFVDMMRTAFPSGSLIALLAAVVLAPVLEELLFRGLILGGLLERFRPANAIAISTLLFATAHLNPWQFVSALFLGSVAGWLFYRTGSLLPSIAAHVAQNAGATWTMGEIGQLFGLPPEAFDGTTSATVLPLHLTALGCILLLLGAILTHRAISRASAMLRMADSGAAAGIRYGRHDHQDLLLENELVGDTEVSEK